MRGFIVASKKLNNINLELAENNHNENGEKILGVSIQKLLPEDSPKVSKMKDLAINDIKILLSYLNDDTVKVQLFKFLHDLHMFFGNQDCCSFSEYQDYI